MRWAQVFKPSRSQMRSSASGPICPNVPTAPEILPTRISSAAAREALAVALHFVIPKRQLQAEGDRLGMNSVRAPDLHRVLELVGARLQSRRRSLNSRR